MIDSIYITKILTSLAYPVGLIVVFFLLSKLLFWSGRRGLAGFFTVCSLLVFCLSSNPIFANWLAASLEQQHPQQAIENIEQHDAIIVLGGGLVIPIHPALHSQLTSASDRYWHATELYKAGKAKKLFLSGGNLFTQRNKKTQVLMGEAAYARELLVKWGVNPKDIIVEQNSRTTEENLDNMIGVINKHNINAALLVTSAMHMPRAYTLFSALPLQLTPASADISVTEAYVPPVFMWLPSVSAIHKSTKALHEYYGLWVLSIKKFITPTSL